MRFKKWLAQAAAARIDLATIATTLKQPSKITPKESESAKIAGTKRATKKKPTESDLPVGYEIEVDNIKIDGIVQLVGIVGAEPSIPIPREILEVLKDVLRGREAVLHGTLHIRCKQAVSWSLITRDTATSLRFCVRLIPL